MVVGERASGMVTVVVAPHFSLSYLRAAIVVGQSPATDMSVELVY